MIDNETLTLYLIIDTTNLTSVIRLKSNCQGAAVGLLVLIVGKQSRTVRSDADAADKVFHNDDLQSFDSRYYS